ncbi:hypothetical protein MMAGJ_50140 [Mycolicibacterium mageritense]|uniref:Uncharacterized protein n=1 Tax=Mycolicibacterium mageritense TaxID=53462 RepID=A0ABM7HYP3_MYCME|nr:hypothetical protein MMAGJ_50140 [Mycolicibacterium mageritense]GJJ19357.1 hypothetical protein MTY414_30300 [Mycolicibacterium mageritense]
MPEESHWRRSDNPQDTGCARIGDGRLTADLGAFGSISEFSQAEGMAKGKCRCRCGVRGPGETRRVNAWSVFSNCGLMIYSRRNN